MMPSPEQVRAAFARAVREAPDQVIAAAEVEIDTHAEFQRDVSVIKIEITNELIEMMIQHGLMDDA